MDEETITETLREAAEFLSRGEDSVRELICARAFPVIQLGKRSKIWIDIADLEGWINQQKINRIKQVIEISVDNSKELDMDKSQIMIRGRKRILARLTLENWSTVMRMKEEEGLPITKIVGIWTTTEELISSWVNRKCDPKGEFSEVRNA